MVLADPVDESELVKSLRVLWWDASDKKRLFGWVTDEKVQSVRGAKMGKFD